MLWPMARTRWIVYTADGDLYEETLDDYASAVKLTGVSLYPTGVNQVVAFEFPVEDGGMLKLLKSAKRAVRGIRAEPKTSGSMTTILWV